MKETGLTKIDNGIFVKIKNFFKNLFKRNKNNIVEETKESIENNGDKGVFKQTIKIEEDKEKIRLLKLQEDFANGKILEEDINDEDTEKLFELYDEQIKKINNEIEIYKQKILSIKEKLT